MQMLNHYSFIGTPKSLSMLILSPTTIIIFGALVIFYSILSFCATCTNDRNRGQLCIFASLMGIILIVQLSIVISLLVYKEKASVVIQIGMKESLDLSAEAEFKNFAKLWDSIQTEFKCCGIDNQTDWTVNNKSIPKSCCSEEVMNQCTNEYNGCLETFTDFMKGKYIIHFAVGAVIIMIQVIDVISAFLLAMDIKKKTQYTKPPIFKDIEYSKTPFSQF